MKKFNFDDLNNKVAVVTGGSGGIGIALVDALAEVGAKVAIISRNKATAENALSEIGKTGSTNVLIISADVLDAASLEKANDRIKDTFGEIDLLINCAGGNSPKATTSDEFISDSYPKGKEHSFFGLDIEELKNIFDLNLFGTLLPTQKFSEGMIKRKKGAILNISSVASFAPLTKVPAYAASKASINSVTQWLAVHFAKSNVRVNAIAPGFFLTRQNRFLLMDEKTGKLSSRAEKIIAGTPMGRFGETNELQGAALFLLSDLSQFVNGVVLPVDGGFLAYSGI